MSTRFAVDLDLLDEVVHRLGQHHTKLDELDARLAATVRRLHGDWLGAAADAHADAQARWDAGFATMRAALAHMRSAAEMAQGNYRDAAEANVRLWQELT
ncbi:WXG100 family type VII secretion target [Nocardioides sp.]|uniref:WXG100 family type VII secretion target n=1 Tax=Nocardioides sp. TaxID=35761 RepID=UPI002ED2FE42